MADTQRPHGAEQPTAADCIPIKGASAMSCVQGDTDKRRVFVLPAFCRVAFLFYEASGFVWLHLLASFCTEFRITGCKDKNGKVKSFVSVKENAFTQKGL